MHANHFFLARNVLSNGTKSEITLKHLLTMRTGLEWNEFSRSNFQHLYHESDDTIEYEWSKADLNLKIFIDGGKLLGKTILFDNEFEIFPVEKNRFICFLEDVGRFLLDAIDDANGNIESVKLIIGNNRSLCILHTFSALCGSIF